MVGTQGWMSTIVIFFRFALVQLTKAALFAQINYCPTTTSRHLRHEIDDTAQVKDHRMKICFKGSDFFILRDFNSQDF